MNDGKNAGEAEIVLDEFIRQFEMRTLSKAEWTHGAHLRIGGCYVLAYGQAAALEKLRVSIRALNDSHGVPNSDTEGYHETLTCFWVAIINRFLIQYRSAHAEATRAGCIGELIESLAHRSTLFKDYWSIDVPRSAEARKHWIAPDRLPLDVTGLFPAKCV